MIRIDCKKMRPDFKQEKIASETEVHESDRQEIISSLGRSSRLLAELVQTIINSIRIKR